MSNHRVTENSDLGLLGFYLISVSVLIFILLPIITIFAYSLVGSFDGGFFSSLTFEYYRAALSNNSDPFVMSLQIAFVTTLIDVFIGVPAAYVLVKYEFPFNNVLRELTILPMAIPGIVIGIGVVRFWGTPR